MTSVDPSHFPPLAHRSRHTGGPATASIHPRPRADSLDSQSGRLRPLPPIPDLRFEQAFLKTISPYLTTRRIESNERQDEKTEGGLEDEEGAVEVVGVQWSKVLWIVTRDQMMSPLAQGLIW